MAHFEGYERREAKILGVLNQYGISSIDECKEICDAKGINPYKIVEETQPIAFENAKWAYTVGAAIAIK
ncbi:MAG: GGGtGRT protein, partial [Clostridia bacterium]|nr:GGGtGRT protein [Clostridia bacterium]